MLDEILDMFGRKKRSAGDKPGGSGSLMSRVQGVLDGDDDRHRSGYGRSHRDDDHDDDNHFDRDDDRSDRRGRRRERDGFDLGDD